MSSAAQCDPIDFNRDGLFPDTQDQDDFLSVFNGGPCSTGDCGDIDFNNDSLFPDTADIEAFLRVFGGGPCHTERGWSGLPDLPRDARVVYVADSGSESNNGLSPDMPLRRWPTAWSLLRDGYGDRVCVVGDLTLDEVNGAGVYHRSGANEYAPLVIYGQTPDGRRPVVTRRGSGAAFYIGGSRADHIWLVNLDIRGEDGAAYGVQSYVTGTDWLIEGCSVTGFGTGINIDGTVSGLTVRRTVVADNQTTTAHSQGVFLNNVNGATFDECVIDRNGRGYPGGAGTIYNHNAYITASCSNIRFVNCIVSRASATGLQLRWNRQDAIGNLVINCPLGITLGHDSKAITYPVQYVTGSVLGNYIVGTADISPTEPRCGPGIGFGLAKYVTVSGNHFIDAPNARYGAIRSDRPSENVRVVGNYSEWPTPLMEWGGTANPLEPTNTIDTAQESKRVGTIEGYLRHFRIEPATKERFIGLARANRRGAWDERWTSQGYIEWARRQ